MWKQYYILASLFILSTLSPAHSNQRFKHITIKDGLSQSSIKCIHQDSKGFLWIGTADGLNKYDGYQFEIYSNDPLNTYSISGNDISCIYENSYDSTLWIGTQGEGLNIYDRKHDAFISYSNESGNKHSLPGNNIRAIKADNQGKLWIASNRGGLCYYNPVDSSFHQTKFSHNPDFITINCIEVDSHGDMWLGSNTGVFKWTKQQQRENTLPQLVTIHQLPHYTRIRAMKLDFKGNLWVGTWNRGLYKYHTSSGETKIFQHSNYPGSISSNMIRAILHTHNGTIWIATMNGLCRYNLNNKNFDIFKNNPEDPESLNYDIVYSLFQDHSGIIWIGTYLGGLNKLDPIESRFPKYTNLVIKQKKHRDYNDTRSICKDNKGTLWIGTSKGLLEVNQQKLSDSISTNGITIHFPGESIGQIHFNKKHGLFISTSRGIINKKENHEYENLTPSIKKQTGKTIRAYSDGITDSDGTIWFGAGNGLLMYNPKANLFNIKTPHGPDGEEIPEQFLSLEEDYTGKIWLGTFDGDLYRYDKHTDIFELIIPFTSSNDLVSFSKIFSIAEGLPGMIWLGTNRGLYKYNDNNTTLERYLKSDGLPNNVVYSVVRDEKNNLWCSTNKGISMFDAKTKLFRNYTFEDGLQNNEFNQGAYFKSDDGTIYMGGIDGLNIFHPSKIITNTFSPPVVITSMQLQYKPVTLKSHPKILDSQISATKNIVLNHNQNTFSFEFTALSFSLPLRNKYQYCLTKIGQNDIWIDANHRRFASYTNVPPGEYLFKVKGSNSDSFWNNKPTVLSITIRPPFWQTWWFRISFYIFLSGCIYLVFYLRLKGIKTQKTKLENIVHIKTQELVNQKEQIELKNKELLHINEELNNSNKRIRVKNKEIAHQRDNLLQMADQIDQANQAKLRFFTSISHELRTPLTLIIGPLKSLLLNLEKIDYAELQQKFSIIYGNANKLLLIVNQLLEFRKVETDNMQMQISKFDAVSFVRHTASMFNELAKQKKCEFNFSCDNEKIKIWADKEKLEKIIYNILSNAFKYTPDQGRIEINLTNTDKSIIIKIKDTGLGMEEEQIPQIFERFFQLDHTQQTANTGSGLGLALTKKYIDLHHGKISVESALNKGSIFTITLPKGKSHYSDDVIIQEHQSSNTSVLSESIGEYSPTTFQVIDTSEDKDKPRLLLIEDDKNLRLYLKDVLTHRFRIIEANDGEKGFKQATSKHPDLIISDVMLPDINGFNLCEKIKEDFNTSHIPIILLTALADHQSQMTGLKVGADSYIAKPFDLTQLSLTIDNLLNNRQKIHHKFNHTIQFNEQDISDNREEQIFIKQATEIVEKHLPDVKFDVVTLCNELGLSQPQVYRKIKALTNLSISEFIRTIRLKKAAQLLQSNKFNVNQVAYEVGFNDPNYFSKCFTKLFGKNPSRFINSH